jgi:hypothetical protein
MTPRVSVLAGFSVSLFCAGVAAVISAQAFKPEALDVKLGLWTLTGTSQTSGGPKVDTSKMSDQEKAMVGAMMQQMQRGGSTPQTSRQCVTKDRLTQALFQPEDPKTTKCARTLVAGTAASQDSTFECSGDYAASGKVHMDRVTDESIQGAGTMTVKGQDMNVSFSFTAKWMGEDCRGIK